tara:strand:+ start:1851 stop:2564 length:714 start_codon:yes stop_codon:yes gene_type:complete
VVNKLLTLVQARMGSKRCPGKSLSKIQNARVIEYVLNRLSRCKNIREIILVTSNKKKDKKLGNFVERKGFKVFYGSENDLISRYIGALDSHSEKKDKYFFKVAADNPFICWNEVDKLIKVGIESKAYFCSYINNDFAERNNDFAGELISINGLRKVNKSTNNKYDREHVYPYYFRNSKKFRVKRIEVSNRLKTSIKFDLDYKEDLKFFRKIGRSTKKKLINLKSVEIIKLGKKIKNV